MVAGGHHGRHSLSVLDHGGSVRLCSYVGFRALCRFESATTPVDPKTRKDCGRRDHAYPRAGDCCYVTLLHVAAFDTGSAKSTGVVSESGPIRDLAALDRAYVDLGSITIRRRVDYARHR